MRHPMMRSSRLVAALMLAGFACAQTPAESSSPTASPVPTTSGQARVASKVSMPFAALAGSNENAIALANALRTGTPATLSYSSIGDTGASSTTTIMPPTKPMGWGNVSHTLGLARFSLAQAGITNPTGAELQAALLGGTVTSADGNSIPIAGVLQQRASGLGWGEIAKSYGTTMGAINRGIKAPTFAAAPPAPPTQTGPGTGGIEPKPAALTGNSVGTSFGKGTVTTAAGTAAASSHASKGITMASGTSSGARHASKGLTTAGGTAASTSHGTKGVTTASGGASGVGSSGVVSAGGGGHGNAYGRGIVTASGANATPTAAGIARGPSAGTVSANGAAASGIVTAQPDHGNGRGNSNGKGKGGG